MSLSDALEHHPKIFTPLYVAMTRAGETGGMLEEALHADRRPAGEGRTRCAARSARRWPTRWSIVGFALRVLLALVAFLVPVFEGVFEDFDGELPADHEDHASALSHVVTGYWWSASSGPSARVVALPEVEDAATWGRCQWDAFKLKHPDEDRRHRPEDRARALVADVLGARARRRAAARRRSTSPARPPATAHRERDGRRDESVQRGGTIADAAAGGLASSRRWSPTWSASARRPETWTRMLTQGRRLLRGRGRRGGQGADLDPRAGHDHGRRRRSSGSS